ncbi:hypothetical protein ACS7SF_12215 [Ralstonia sp. 25C]|uniref:hypothetical protein n=1 Tax=Ralstonia sp. 25C TaxID=3447363 RepID=UPI003F75360B
MKSLILVAGLLTALLGFDGASATSSLPNAVDIREVDGAPAACLPLTDAETIELQEAYVVESLPRTGEKKRQWALELAPEGKPMLLRPGECVVFNRPVSGYSQGGGLRQVEEGETYTFVLQRGGNFKRGWSPNYIGWLCVTRLPDQHLAYPAYVRHANGTMTYPPCARRRIGGPPAPDGIVPSE